MPVVLVGVEQGSVAALALAGTAPSNVAGVVLLDPAGFPPAERLGSDLLNRLLLRGIAFGEWFLLDATPHFGALDGVVPARSVANVLSRSDWNAVRERVAAASLPVVILAKRDHLPAAYLDAALPTARRETGTPEVWAERLSNGHVGGTAPVPIGTWVLPRVEESGLARFGSLVFAASIVSEDLASVGVGLLLGEGRVSVFAALSVMAAALLLGDLVLVLVGRWLGAALGMRAFPVKGEALFWSRFVPGARLPTFVAAGMNRMPLVEVVRWLGLAVLIWTPFVVLLAAGGARLVGQWLGSERSPDPVRVVVLVVALLAFLRIVVPLATWRGRRRWRGFWIRLTRFEYWPLFAFYAPLIPCAAWWMIRHRSVRAPTLANPGIEGGGLVGESKWKIHQAFPDDAIYLPRTLGLDEPGTEIERAAAWVEAGPGYPVIAKPDVAERGRGVRRIRDAGTLREHLSKTDEALLLQEYVEGIELGVFYVRGAEDIRGEIFAIVLKELPSVVGDGERTLEEMVLADPRAVAMARAYQENAGQRWGEVPERGHRVPLVTIGTHSRGAIFLDGARHRTPELEAAVERIAQDLPGFHFGRIDLRAPDEAALRAGEGLRVLEINGLTAEAAHFYDPAFGVIEAWRWLLRQWRIAFEIGAAHRAAGVVPPTYGELLRLWRRGRAAT